MIKLVLLFITTGAALVVAVALVVGIAWIAVAVPVVIVTGTGYGLIALNRRLAEKLGEEAPLILAALLARQVPDPLIR
jgi:F0F1-type ATP synthase membrane subunit c/vacuolar-type H+-ATPase subunit K